MEGVVIKELKTFTDERGWLVELFRSDETDIRPVMSYLSMTKPGVARGPHEHMEQSDYFFFSGNFRLYLWDNREGSATYKERIVFDTEGKPCIAIVPPRVVHAYKNIGASGGLVLNLPDRLYKGLNKALPVDEVRYEDDPMSPYRID